MSVRIGYPRIAARFGLPQKAQPRPQDEAMTEQLREPQPLIKPPDDFTIQPEQDALLVVDMQPDFMPGGPLAVAEGDQFVAAVAALMQRFSLVVATQDWHPADHISFASQHGRSPFDVIPLYGSTQTLWPDHCIAGTLGAALHPGIAQDRIGILLRKGTHREIDSYSAFRENTGPDGQRRTTGLSAMLSARGIRRIFVCGLARDFCVGWSALDAQAEGLVAIVLDDLTRAVCPDRCAETDALFAQGNVLHGPSSLLKGGAL
jgi:nicotinamidase/pyrazinamidase